MRTALAAAIIAFATIGAHGADFRTGVMAVLSKAGCNAGACHGNGNGKGGFKLSLRGQDPADDWAAIAREHGGRRVNPFDPAQSLVFLKATAAIPHEGGRRFDAASPEGEILLRWLTTGAQDTGADAQLESLTIEPHEEFIHAPRTETRIRVTAKFTDGAQRDVTRLAVFEPSNTLVKISADGVVTSQKPGETSVAVRFLGMQKAARLAFVPARDASAWSAPEPRNFIDAAVFKKLRQLRVNPAPECDDTTFLRRAYLDLLGTLPTAETARAFAADTDPAKRAALVDRLLAREEFNDFWALKWADLLRIEERQLDAKGVALFHGWIRTAIATAMPLNDFAREILAARGSTYSQPPANWWRANRDPVSRAENTARVFLGTQINCAQCHNHPFERWTQADYYGWTAVFRRLDYKILENKRRDKNDQKEFRGEQIVQLTATAPIINPRTGEPAPMLLLGGGAPKTDHKTDELHALAEWLTGTPQFARMQANRIWAQLLGRGIVDPVDDFRTSNPPTNPELLDALGRKLAEENFDLRKFIRHIVLSRTYQSTADGGDHGGGIENIRRLGAEQLLDSAAKALAAPLEIPGQPEATRLAAVPAGRKHYSPLTTGMDYFQLAFGKPPRLVASDCERMCDPTIVQAFQLLSGPVLRGLISRSTHIAAWAAMPPTAAVDAMFWSTLSRAPSPEERTAFEKHTAGGRPAIEDAAWALLNSKEFLFRR